VTDDQHGEGTPRSGSRWDPLPQGDYDDGATAFVKLPEGGIDALLSADSPLAAPGHGYVPPRITSSSPESADPSATGGWGAPGAPAEGTQWPDPNAVPRDAGTGAGGDDRFTYRPGATQQWHFDEVQATQAGQAHAAGHDVTGQWSIPVAGGDLPDESGEFTTSSLIQQWGGTPPATLPGGAPAPWATEPAGQSWGQPQPGAGTDGQGQAYEHGHGTPAGGAHGGRPTAETYRAEPSARGPHADQRPGGEPHGDERSAESTHPAPRYPDAPAEDRTGTGHSPAPAHPAPHEHPAREADPSAEAAGRQPSRQAPSASYPEPDDASYPEPADASRPDARSSDEQETRRRSEQGAEPSPGHAAETSQRGPGAGETDETAAEAADGPAEPSARPSGAEDTGPASQASQGPGTAAASAPPDTDRATSGHTTAPHDGTPPAAPRDEHPLASYVLRVNGVDRPVTDAWVGESLLYVLRERLGLAGAKDGCSQGECGACNVQVDGRLVASCLVPAVTAAGSEVRTVEGLAVDGQPSDVQRALARCGAVQCGFCVPGMAMTVHDLLEGNPAPTELETRQALCGNLCRCSGYRGVLEAVQEVVAEREAHSAADGSESDADEPRIPHQAGPGAGGIHPSAFESPGPHDPYGQDGGQA
jgi:aerobic-type carbon monoxide dehydrogenase small subunit (CoxS/CutS family)